MSSHVVGPLLVADRPLTTDEVTTLDETAEWEFDLLYVAPPPAPYDPTTVSFRARPRHRISNHQRQPVQLARRAPAIVMLPRRHTEVLEQGSNGPTLAVDDTPAAVDTGYGEGLYGMGYYGE